MRQWILLLILFFAYFTLFSSDIEKEADNLTNREISSVIEFLGHDLLEGRAPGARGGDLAEIYMKSLYKLDNILPGYNGKYFQRFRLNAFKTLELEMNINREKLSFPKDIVGVSTEKNSEFDIKGDLVFIGYGIKCDLWKWDDYKGTDIKNKIVLVRVNDPGYYKKKIFTGKKLTYFGRWTYHIEEAAKRGAKAVLLIHTDESAGYSWEVVKNSWSGYEYCLDSDLVKSLKFKGWIREAVVRRILGKSGYKLEKLYKKSLSRRFRPADLKTQIKISGKSDYKQIFNNNVVGLIKGKSPETIVLSAHIDHLGMSDKKNDDNIYNGAIDNSSAVSAMLLCGRILNKYRGKLNYSVILLACNSEEGGLLGSKYYALGCDREKTIANINFESTPVWEKSTSIMGIGAEFSEIQDMLKTVADEMKTGYSEFSLSNQGLFYRSDQFSFARCNIPAVWISAGEQEINGMKRYTEFWSGRYHTVKDEYKKDWKFDGLRQTVSAALRLILKIDRLKRKPEWKNNLTFPMY